MPTRAWAAAPVAIITGDTTDKVDGAAFDVDGSTSTDDGTITAYAWDYGDGVGADNVANPGPYTYGYPGTYTISLTVTDDEDPALEHTATVVVTVRIDTTLSGQVRPVGQNLGRLDLSFTSAMNTPDADGCRFCHGGVLPSTAVSDLHHAKYYTAPGRIDVPGLPGALSAGNYGCLTCHEDGSGNILVYACDDCHAIGSYADSPHHVDRVNPSVPLTASDCGDCHSYQGNTSSWTYSPGEVTPLRNTGISIYENADGVTAGACDFCHVDDSGVTADSLQSVHHGTGLWDTLIGDCQNCHTAPDTNSQTTATFAASAGLQMRACENCHSASSLHSVLYNGDEDGDTTVGGEPFGYGHVGRDNGPADSDCFGCHGGILNTAGIGGASGSDTITPEIYGADTTVVTAGVDTQIVVFGAALTNVTAQGELIESDFVLIAADGSVIVLASVVDDASAIVTILGSLDAGAYTLRAVKEDVESVESDGLQIVVQPVVSITSVVVHGSLVTITGTGFTDDYFGGADSGTSCSTTTGKKKKAQTVEAIVFTWSDTQIQASFDESPSNVTVTSVFGSATADLPAADKPGNGGGNGNGGGKGRNK